MSAKGEDMKLRDYGELLALCMVLALMLMGAWKIVDLIPMDDAVSDLKAAPTPPATPTAAAPKSDEVTAIDSNGVKWRYVDMMQGYHPRPARARAPLDRVIAQYDREHPTRSDCK